jgi:Uma2 family endonuclease
MATAALIPLQEYLSTVYEPDCDYVDGHIEERNLGERPHATLQLILARIFDANRIAWDIECIPELRVQVGPERYRIPDVTVVRRSAPVESIVRTPPLICIEVLSPEDRLQRMQQRINDYYRMGVEHVWLIDPLTRDAWVAEPDGSHQHVSTEFTVLGTPIRIALAGIFADLDDRLTQR